MVVKAKLTKAAKLKKDIIRVKIKAVTGMTLEQKDL